MLKPDVKGAPAIAELVRYTWSETPDLESVINNLRDLVCQYVAATVKVLSENEAFVDLIEEEGLL